jgi:hypothetical protein
MRRSTALLFALSMPMAAWAPGCVDTRRKCAAGQTVWYCSIPQRKTPTYCHDALPEQVCASNVQDAISKGNTQAIADYSLPETPPDTSCFDQHTTSYFVAPNGMPLDSPSCIVTIDDDPCVTCAKTSCCGDYQSCLGGDANCACLVACLSQGGTIAACTATDGCGPFSAVSTSASLCLVAACPAQCGTVGGMASGMCPGSSSSSSGAGTSSSGGPTCTPGSYGPGESCFSDADCSSCICNTQSMACE